MKKIINFRMMLFAAAAVLAGGLITAAIINEKWYLIAFSAAVIAFAVYSVFVSEVVKKAKFIISAVLVGIVLLSFGIGMIDFTAFTTDNYTHQLVTVTARATDDIRIYNNRKEVIADKLEVNGKSVGRKVRIVLPPDTTVVPGWVITVSNCAITADEVHPNNYRHNIKYRVETRLEDISSFKIESGNPSLDARIRSNIREAMDVGLTESQAGIAYALLFGDKSGMSSYELRAYTVAGLAHILSVSGLHISFLIGCISRLLEKLKINRYARLAIIAVPVIFYVWLCGFTPSALRAAIMGIYAATALLLHRKSDRLTSLSLAAILLLVARPLFITDIGFQFSMMSVLAIYCLAAPVQKLLKKIKVPEQAGAPVGVTAAATIGVFPLTATHFGVVSLYSLIYNVLLLPVIMAAYFLIAVVSVFAAFNPAMGVLYYLPRPFLRITEFMASLSYKLPLSGQILFGAGFFGGIFLMCVFVLSRYVLARNNKLRNLLIIATVPVMLTVTIASNIPKKPEPGVFAAPENSMSAVYDSSDGVSCIIGGSGGYDFRYIFEYINGERRRNINYLILTSFRDGDEDELSFYCATLNFKAIILADFNIKDAERIRKATGVRVIPSFADDLDFVAPVYSDGEYAGLSINDSGKKYLFEAKKGLINYQDYAIIFYRGNAPDYPGVALDSEFKIKI